ncbi:unnamed protein product [Rotaria sp. Silwood1]|nr:unnamed protein product [Rotaria sp. Silwood1]
MDEQQTKQLESTFAESLEVVRDLFTVIDITNVLNDTTKQTPWPEAFLAQSSTTVDDNLNYTIEDLDRSKHYFDETTDLQLLNLMNKTLSSDSSFDEFINCLPKELESTAAIYKEYPSLSNIPGDCVRTRAKFFYQLSALIKKVLPTVDLSLPLGQNILMDKFRKAKVYLLHGRKYELLQQSLEQTITTDDNSRPSIQFDTLTASYPSENGENTMFNQAFKQLFKDAPIKFRRADERLWHATYVGMHSIDAGGPYRDSITFRSNSSATSTNESTTVFDDRLERTLNSRGRYARLGSTGKFYCGGTLDGSQCNCCNGKCGPTNGCNCSSCMLLDVQKRILPRGWLVNSDGAPARCSSQLPTTFYCGRRVMPDDGTSDGYCGPTNGPQCTACQRLNQQQRDRYKHIWIG